MLTMKLHMKIYLSTVPSFVSGARDGACSVTYVLWIESVEQPPARHT